MSGHVKDGHFRCPPASEHLCWRRSTRSGLGTEVIEQCRVHQHEPVSAFLLRAGAAALFQQRECSLEGVAVAHASRTVLVDPAIGDARVAGACGLAARPGIEAKAAASPGGVSRSARCPRQQVKSASHAYCSALAHGRHPERRQSRARYGKSPLSESPATPRRATNGKSEGIRIPENTWRTAEIRPDRQTLKRKCITSPSRTT